MAEGYDIGVFSGVIVRVEDEFKLDAVQIGMLIGWAHLMEPLGALLAGYLADRFGRLLALAVTHATLFGAILGVALAPTFNILMVFRVLVGLGLGLGLCVESLYIAECTPLATRGVYTSATEIAINAGILLGFIANAALYTVHGVNDWRWMLGVGAILPCIALVALGLRLFPESPRYLLLQGREAEAKATLTKLVSEEEAERALLQWSQRPDEAGWLPFNTPVRRRMLLAGAGVAVFQLGSGIGLPTTLSSYILNTRWTAAESFKSTVFMGVVKTATIVAASFYLIDRVGRRPLLLLSAVGMSVSCAYIAYTFDADKSLTIVLSGFMAFVFFFSLGFGPVTYAYMPEVFDNAVRSAGVGVSLGVSRVVGATVYMVTPPFLQGHGDNVPPVFLFFAGVNIIAVVYVYFLCPETAGVTLEEMRRVFAQPGDPKTPLI
jgi:sugar porter (SP) family MFS transporter